MASMAEELASQAEQLQSTMSFFKIDTVTGNKETLSHISYQSKHIHTPRHPETLLHEGKTYVLHERTEPPVTASVMKQRDTDLTLREKHLENPPHHEKDKTGQDKLDKDFKEY
jgi:hypothetical protein